MVAKFPAYSKSLRNDPTTRRLWFGMAVAHDFERHDGITEEFLYRKIFASNFGQLSIIFLWTSGSLFHVSSQGNFETWIQDPLHSRPIAHIILDPHYGQPAIEAYSMYGNNPVNVATSGVYQWWYTIGMRSDQDLFNGSIFLCLIAALIIFAGWLHLQPKFQPRLFWFKNAESRLNHHLSGLLGVSSLAWTGHLVHVRIPRSRGERVDWYNFLSILPHPYGLKPFFSGHWIDYASAPDKVGHVFGTSQSAGSAILTFLGGFHPDAKRLFLSDLAHHHLAIAVLFIIAGHIYRTKFDIGHGINTILNSHVSPSGSLGRGHINLYYTVNDSVHFQLGLALASLGTVRSLVAQHIYSMSPYAFLSQDFTAQSALYTHHQYIRGFIMSGSFAHGAIFFVRDYEASKNRGNVLERVIAHKEVLISHLSWVSLFLGFHTLGIYVHNDVIQSFGISESQILIEPVFRQWIQTAQGKYIYGFEVLLSSPNALPTMYRNHIWLSGWLTAINNTTGSLFLPVGPGDFLDT
jgi:photosystem I P700 chlorophyll a apoprotein A2